MWNFLEMKEIPHVDFLKFKNWKTITIYDFNRKAIIYMMKKLEKNIRLY